MAKIAGFCNSEGDIDFINSAGGNIDRILCFDNSFLRRLLVFQTRFKAVFDSQIIQIALAAICHDDVEGDGSAFVA